MSDAIVECSMNDLSAFLIVVNSTEVVPEAKRNSWQFDSAFSAAAVLHGIIPVCISSVRHSLQR
jgi:hypothetical protein